MHQWLSAFTQAKVQWNGFYWNEFYEMKVLFWKQILLLAIYGKEPLLWAFYTTWQVANSIWCPGFESCADHWAPLEKPSLLGSSQRFMRRRYPLACDGYGMVWMYPLIGRWYSFCCVYLLEVTCSGISAVYIWYTHYHSILLHITYHECVSVWSWACVCVCARVWYLQQISLPKSR